MDLRTSFQNGCDEITAALAAKGITPDSNSPEDIAKALDGLSTASIAKVFTSSPVNMSLYTEDWKNLTEADFVVGATGASAYAYTIKDTGGGMSGQGASANSSVTFNYNSTNGLLSFYHADSGRVGSVNTAQAKTSGTLFAVWLGTVGGK